VFAWIDGDAGLRTWWSLRSDLAEASGRIETLRDGVETTRLEAAALEDEEFAIERAIRERLEYARPGETLVRLRGTSDGNSRFR